MSELNLQFFSGRYNDSGRFRLLQLPSDPNILNEVRSLKLDKKGGRLFLKEEPGKNTFLCTESKTYKIQVTNLRSAFRLVTPTLHEEGGKEDILIGDTIPEILETHLHVPDFNMLEVLLKDSIYEDNEEEKPAKRPRLTYNNIQSELHASEKDMDRNLNQKRILRIDGYLRPISPAHLNKVLVLIISTLVSLSLPPIAVPLTELVNALNDNYNIRPEITKQILLWFGEISNSDDPNGIWKMDVEAIVKQIGLGILADNKIPEQPIDEADFLSKWRLSVGDAFVGHVNISLLKGYYLSYPQNSQTRTIPRTIIFFPPSSLPDSPPERFAKLFAMRSSWRLEDISPYLVDIATGGRSIDKLLREFARQTSQHNKAEKWYSAKTADSTVVSI